MTMSANKAIIDQRRNIMRLNRPTKNVFYIAVISGILGVAGKLFVPFLAPYAFWLVLVGFVLLVLGNTLKGF